MTWTALIRRWALPCGQTGWKTLGFLNIKQLYWLGCLGAKSQHNKTSRGSHLVMNHEITIEAIRETEPKHLFYPFNSPLTSPFSSWTISTLRSVSLGSSSLKFSIFLQRRGILPSHVYIWDFYMSQWKIERGDKKRNTVWSRVNMHRNRRASLAVAIFPLDKGSKCYWGSTSALPLLQMIHSASFKYLIFFGDFTSLETHPQC